MTVYEFYGSVRVEANSEDEATDMLHEIEKAFAHIGCEIYSHEMEEVE